MSADINLQFCSAQAVFGSGTTVQSTDWIDWKVAQAIADGQAPVLEVIVTTSFAGGTSAQFQMCAVDAAGANPEVIATTRAIPIAELVANGAGTPGTIGTIVHLRMDPLKALPGATKTHLRLQTVNVGANAAGAITAHLVPEAGTSLPGKAYPIGY